MGQIDDAGTGEHGTGLWARLLPSHGVLRCCRLTSEEYASPATRADGTRHTTLAPRGVILPDDLLASPKFDARRAGASASRDAAWRSAARLDSDLAHAAALANARARCDDEMAAAEQSWQAARAALSDANNGEGEGAAESGGGEGGGAAKPRANHTGGADAACRAACVDQLARIAAAEAARLDAAASLLRARADAARARALALARETTAASAAEVADASVLAGASQRARTRAAALEATVRVHTLSLELVVRHAHGFLL